jgi:hypothetical protein
MAKFDYYMLSLSSNNFENFILENFKVIAVESPCEGSVALLFAVIETIQVKISWKTRFTVVIFIALIRNQKVAGISETRAIACIIVCCISTVIIWHFLSEV